MSKKIYYSYSFLMNSRFSRGVMMLFCLYLGVSVIEFGFIQSAYYFSRMFFEIPSGIIADKFKRKYVLFAGSFLGGFSALCLFLLSVSKVNFNVTYIVAFLFVIDALGGTLISGTEQALLYDFLDERNQKDRYLKILSNSQIISLVSLAIATAVGGTISDFAIGVVYLAQFLCYLVASVIILFFDEGSSKKEKKITKKQNSLKEQLMLTYKYFRSSNILVVIVLFSALLEVLVNTIMIFIQGAFSAIGLSDSLIGYVISATTLIGVIGAILARLLEKINIEILFLSMSVLIFLNSILLSSTNKILMILGFTMINLLLDASMPYISNAINNEIDSKVRATIISISSSLTGLIAVIFYPIFGSMVNKFNYEYSFLITGIIFSGLMFLISILSIRFFKRKKQELSE